MRHRFRIEEATRWGWVTVGYTWTREEAYESASGGPPGKRRIYDMEDANASYTANSQPSGRS